MYTSCPICHGSQYIRLPITLSLQYTPEGDAEELHEGEGWSKEYPCPRCSPEIAQSTSWHSFREYEEYEDFIKERLVFELAMALAPRIAEKIIFEEEEEDMGIGITGKIKFQFQSLEA